jgi:hypothetical protein
MDLEVQILNEQRRALAVERENEEVERLVLTAILNTLLQDTAEAEETK